MQSHIIFTARTPKRHYVESEAGENREINDMESWEAFIYAYLSQQAETEAICLYQIAVGHAGVAGGIQLFVEINNLYALSVIWSCR